MKTKSLASASRSVRVFIVCLLLFNICIAPIGAMAASVGQRSEVRGQRSEKKDSSKAAAGDVFAHPLEVKTGTSLPNARPEPAPLPPLPFAPPAGSDISATLTASLLAANGGVDADSDGKADPGDTISYSATLTSSGAGGTGLSFSNPLDSHTTLVAGTLNSTPVAFDQSVSTNEDIALSITIQGQDPDGSNLTFVSISSPASGTLGAFGSVTCTGAGVCSQTATYTPNANFFGSDSFNFRVNDGTANSNQTGVVSITVNGVNDAPTFTVPANPAAVNEDAGATTVSNYITAVRPAQSGNTTEDTQTVSFVITNVTHSALFQTQPALNVVGASFPKTANLTYTPAANANGTSVVTYHLKDNGCPGSPGTPCPNGGVDISADQTFTITVNAVNDPPVAQAKSFTVQANMKITGLTGLLTGVTDPDATNGAADASSFDAQAGYTAPVATVTSLTLNTCTNGTIFNLNASTGTFDFDPPPGLSGGSTCVLNYQVTDTKNPAPGAVSATQTITITAQGPAIWFVSPAAGPETGDGRLSTPFKLLSSANAKLNSFGVNQKVFVYTGSTTIGATEVLDLKSDNDWLVGQGTVAPSGFDTFFGITPPANTIARPTLNSSASTANAARPTVRGTVTMRNNTQVTGVNIDVSGAAAGSKGISGVFTSGTSLVKDVNVTSAAGNAVDVSGAQTFSYVTSDGTNSPNILSSGTGTALSVVNTTIGSAGLTFRSITAGTAAGSAGDGIILDTTGSSGGLTVTGNGGTCTVATPTCTGGTIQHKTGADGSTTNGIGIYLNNTSNVSLTRMHLNDFDNFAIRGLSVTNFALDNSIINGQSGNVVNASDEAAIRFGGTLDSDGTNGLVGTASISNCNISGGYEYVIKILNNSGTLNRLIVSNTTIGGNHDAATGNGGDAFQIATNNSATANVTVKNSIFTSAGADLFDAIAHQSSNMDLVFQNNNLSNNHANLSGASTVMLLFSTSIGNVTYDISNNTIVADLVETNHNTSNGIAVAKGIPDTSPFGGTMSGVVNGNTIGQSGVVGSGSSFTGIFASALGSGTHTTAITNNTVYHYNEEGIFLKSNDPLTGGNAVLNATLTGNLVTQPDSFAFSGLWVDAGSGSGTENHVINLVLGDVSTTAVAGSPTGSLQNDFTNGDPANGTDILFQELGSNSVINLSKAGSASGTVQAVVDDDNVGTSSQAPSGTINLITAQTVRLIAAPITVYEDGTANTTYTFLRYGDTTAALTANFNVSGTATFATDYTQSGAATFSASTGTVTFPAHTDLVKVTIDPTTDGGTEPNETVTLTLAAGAGYTVASPSAATTTIINDDPPTAGTFLTRNLGSPPPLTASAQTTVATISNSSSQISMFSRAMNSVVQLATSFASLLEPTAYAETKTRGGSQEAGDSNQSSEVKAQRSDARLNHAAQAEIRGLRSDVKANHATRAEIRGQRSEVRNHATTASLVPPMSPPPGTFPINGTGSGFTLPAGKTTTITFKATMNAPPALSGVPPAAPKVSAQGSLSGSFAGNPIVTDDTAVGGTADPTLTNVDLYDSTMSLGSSPNPSNTTQAVTLTATIGTSGTPNGSATNRTGTVVFKDNGTTITCTGGNQNVVSNQATCITSGLSTGTHTNVTAEYSGDGSFDPSNNNGTPLSQTVTKVSTTTAVTSGSNPSRVNESVTFTATVTSGNGSIVPPTGTVQFHEGVTNFGAPVALTSGGACPANKGCASIAISTLTFAGSPHTITADFLGDTTFDISNGSVSQTVNKSDTSTAIASSQNPSFVSQGVTFTATITSLTAIVPPTGTVQFHEGATNFGAPVTLTTGGGCPANKACATSATISSLTAGAHTIAADYLGDAAFNASANSLAQQVNQSNTTMTVLSSLNPSKVTESVTFTVQIISSNLGTVPGPPTGTVKFWDGPANTGTQIGGNVALTTGGTCPANNACANSAAIASLTAGTHTITVEYLGDTSFSANSATLSGGQVVNKSDTTTTLNSSLNPSNFSDPVTFTAHVTSSGVTFTNTGTVEFKDGATTISGCGAQPINGSGDATCLTSSLPNGTHSITAVYSGDATFNTSTSNTVSQQVGPVCPSSVVVTSNADNGAGTLRQAIFDVCDGGTITFDPVAFPAPGPNFIDLIDPGAPGVGGELLLSKSVTITGPAASILTVRRASGAATDFRVFEINPGKTVAIAGMTISNGKASGVSPANLGGGIYNDHGILTLTGCVISGNTADTGGAIDNEGSTAGSASLTISKTAISGNTANNNGGGIYNNGQAGGSATLTINQSTISGNDAGLITNGLGGGIASEGAATVTMTNSTISGNRAGGFGGGVSINGGTATLTALTITGNIADNDNDNIGTGGGLRAQSGAATLQDTIVAGNFKGVGSGVMQQETGTVVAATGVMSGTQQIDVLTVGGGPVATCSGSGNIKLNVTANGMSGSGVDVLVPITEPGTAATVTGEILSFLTGGGAPNITSFFVVTQTGPTELTFTAKAAANNDGARSITVADGSCTGITGSSANSVNGASSGNAKVIVTAAALPGGTKTLSVPVAKPDTQDDVASKMRAALSADTDINTKFSVTGSTNQIILTRLVSAPNDATLNIETDNDTCTGLTDTTPSTDTTGGVGSASAHDISGSVAAASSYNLIGDAATAGGLIDVSTDAVHKNQVGNAGVGTVSTATVIDLNLADNGGPTRTHKLVNNSPAIDKGNAFALTTDQRGFQRPVDLPDATYPNTGDAADIGAFEVQGATPVPTISLTSTNGGGPSFTTRDSTPDFSVGNLIVGAVVELLRDGTPTSPATTVIATSATMSLTDNTLTTDGAYSYTAKQTVGSDAQTSAAQLVTVDTRPTAPDLLTADDTVGAGGTNTDNITSNTTPRFTGTTPTDPNTTIRLFADSGGGPVQVGTTTSDGSGDWTITSSALAPGTYSITAKEVFGTFVGAASTALTPVVIDTTIAAPSIPDLLNADDSGTLDTDNFTSNTTPRFTGTAEPNSAVQLFANGNPVGSTTADGSGNWTITSSALSDATYLMTAKATDLAGNVSALSGSLSVTIDTQAPSQPSIPDLIAGDDTGSSDTDNYTKKTTPTFTGTAEAGSTVELFADATSKGTVLADGGGNWSITSSALTDGTYLITAKARDAAGNTSIASGSLSVTIDTTAPNQPTIPDLIAADDTGSLDTDNYTKKTTPTFSGTAEAGSTVELFAGATSKGTVTADGGGNWSITSSALTDGTYLMTATATDAAGNTSTASGNLSVTIDTAPPAQPSAPDLIDADDTGILNTDNLTNKNTPTFTGTAEANSTVQLFAGATPVGSGTAAGGNWSITSGLLPDNSYNMTAQAIDLAGNVSPASTALAIVIDTIKPGVSMASGTGNPTATTPIPVTATFTEPVSGFGAGNIVTANGTVGNFAGSNANYTFDLTPVAPGAVSADIAAGVATDAAGNTNTAAIQFNRTFDPSALNATVTAISPNPRNTAVTSIQIVFNKAVTGFDLGDLTLKLNNGTNLLTGAQTLNSADNATWTLGNLAVLTAAQGTYDLKLTAAGSNIQDATSTALASDATASWVMDTTAPTVTVEQVGPDPVTGPSGTTVINFTATFTEAVTGLTTSGVTLSGTANPTIVNVTGSGTTYNLAVEGMSGSGTVVASINAGAAQDSAGNGNAASTSADNTVQFNADNYSTLEVNSTADPGDGFCDPIGTGDGCTLREAINAANADFGADVITFNSTVFAAPGPYTINLGSVLPDITSDMTITGPGAKVLTVKRNAGSFRIFFIHNGATAAISDLTVTNGNAPGGGGIVVGANTLDLDTLTLTRVAVTGNTATGVAGGGGILVRGTLNVIESTISGNHASIVSNTSGGGIVNIGTLSVVNSTISGNDAANSGLGGGVFTTGTTTLSNSTIAGNSAAQGGGVMAGGTVTLKSTIIGDNTATVVGPDVSDGGGGGTFNSEGFNLIENTAGATINETLNPGTNITGQDPQLNPLADNGGPTMTHSLLCTSPAIDKGRAFGLTTDQLGGTRPFDFADAVYPNAAGGDGTDIGAYETQSAGGCVPTAVPPSPAPSTNEETPVVITLTGTYSQNTNLSFSITQNPTIGQLGAISAPNCVFAASMTCTATVTYTPNANANGADIFKFKVSAGGLDSDPEDVNVTVNPINDAPSFFNSGTQTVAEDAGPQTIGSFANTISPGPPDESVQTVQFIVTNNTNAALFSAAPSIDPAGQLTFTSAPNAYGSAQITIVLKDNGGTGGGNVDTSASQVFTINVTGVADTPSVTNASTTVNTQTTSGLVISRNTADAGEVTHFQITNITNGTLFKNNGTTQINNNDFITFVEGNQGLKFTPALNSNTNGSFDVQASLNTTAGGLGGGTATATITINCGPAVVTNSNDSGAGSLRDVILHACPGATITFNMTPGNVTSPITLTSGELLIDKNLTIQGPGANLLTVSGNNASRIFNIQAGMTAGISGLTLSNGNSASDGGGIVNQGTLTLTASVITNSTSPGSGGGVVNTGGATMTIAASTINGNSAPVGAGIANGGALTILNSTVAANSGRGFTNSAGTATIINSTFSGNAAAGIEANVGVSIGNSIVANAQNNSADVEGTFTSQGNNLIGDKGGSTGFTNGINGDQVGTAGALVNPLLAPLAGNGGPTQTQALLPGSPAIDSGINTLATNAGLTTDQRGAGFNRIVNTTVDIGAFESRGFTIAVTSGNLQSAVFNTAFGVPLVATVSSAFGEPVSGGQVVFTAPGSGAGATFTGGVTTIASVINAGGQASASATANGTVGGPYNVTAAGNGITGTANFSLTNIKANQTINFAALANKTFGDPDFGVSATSTSGLTVSFAATANCTVTSPSPGTVHLTGAGSCTITASQAGDANYNPATNVPQSFNIAKAATSTAVTSSVNPSDFGQSITFTATVTSGAGTPTATVQFKDNGTNLGSAVALNASGVAQFTTSSLTVGTHTITAEYTGDANFLLSTGTLSSGQVVKAQPSLSINDVSIVEGDAGTKVLNFTVTLSVASSLTVTTNYATANGTATAPSDYAAIASSLLTFNPGDTSKTVSVTINGDFGFEPDETFFVNLSNSVNATISDNQGLGTIQNDDAQGGFISFSQTNYNVSESTGLVTVTVTRTNDVSQAANVDYATDDTGAPTNCSLLNTGLASQRCDYTSMFGTLKFAADETQKTIDIPINLDAYTEGPEVLKVNLSNATGGAVLAVPTTATVTISDSPSPTPNANDDTTSFVRQQYHDFLNREADAAGLAFWKNNIDKCNDPAQRPAGQTLAACIEVQRITTSAAFFLSLEFKGTGGLVRDFYVAALDRPLTNNMPNFVEFMRDTQAIQKGVTVGQGNWQQVLDDNRTAFMNEFVTRAEFVALYPTTDTPTQYVDKLYQHANVTGTQQDRLDAIADFGGAATAADTGARARALLRVTQSGDFQAREVRRAFVHMQYLGYLRRNPNDAPDNNFDGFNFWVNKLNQFNGDFLQAEMVKAFLSSLEYRQRFGP